MLLEPVTGNGNRREKCFYRKRPMLQGYVEQYQIGLDKIHPCKFEMEQNCWRVEKVGRRHRVRRALAVEAEVWMSERMGVELYLKYGHVQDASRKRDVGKKEWSESNAAVPFNRVHGLGPHMCLWSGNRREVGHE